MSRHHLHTEIEIAVGAERIWAILTDFGSYPDWNPFIRSVRGNPQPGEYLEVRIEPEGARGMSFRPLVLAAREGSELRWLGRLAIPGLLDGEHGFHIQPIADRKVLFRHSGNFSGVLVPFFRHRLDRDAMRGFNEMNHALKSRAESPAGRPGVPD